MHSLRRMLLTSVAGLAALLLAGSAGAKVLPYSGFIAVQIATLPGAVAGAGGGVVVNGSGGGLHINTLTLSPGAFGPITTSVPVTASVTINSVRFSGVSPLGGSFAISGGPPGGGAMGLSGLAKVCLVLAPCPYAAVPVPFSPTGATGFGIGGTQTVTGGVDVTLQHSPWQLGVPIVTIHAPTTTISTPALPAGFAHGPATLTSSTGQNSGVIQLVTVTKTFTGLTGAFPELPVIGLLNLHFIPEPGTLLLLGAGVASLAAAGRRKRSRR